MDISTSRFYVINIVSIWILMAVLHSILLLHVTLYYLLLTLICMFIINDKLRSSKEYTFDKMYQLINVISVLWTVINVTNYTKINNANDLSNHDSWLDMIIRIASAILVPLAYFFRLRQKSETKLSDKTDIFEHIAILIYLSFVGLYSLLLIGKTSSSITLGHDNTFSFIPWVIDMLLLINFITINVYEKSIFGQRFLVELLHSALVYLGAVCTLKIAPIFVVRYFFGTYIIAAIIYRKYSYNDQWIDSKLPGSLLRMNMLLAKMFYKANYELINVLRDYVQEYTGSYGICQSVSGLRRLIIVTDKLLINHILANPSIYEQGTPVRNATKIVGDNAFPKFVGKQYHKHKQHFQPGRLAELSQIHLSGNLVTCVDNLVTKWKNEDQSGFVDEKTLWPNLHRLMFDIFGLTMIGYDYGSIIGAASKDRLDDMSNVRPAALYYLNMLVKAAQTQCPFSLYIFYHRNFNQTYKQAQKTMQNHCREIVAEYLQQPERFEKMEAKPILYQIVRDMNLYDERNRLTSEELVDDISDLLAAGTDSISTVLSWAIFYLSKEFEIQNKIRQELVEHNLFQIKRFTYEELDCCQYLRRFVKELLRHAPINVPIQRTAVKHDTLKHFKVYPGDELMLMARDVSQNDQYWPNSKVFEPDRTEWMTEKNDNIKHLLTFGGGARACPGRTFSQLQLRAVIALLLMRVEFHDTPENIGGETSMLEGVVKPKHVKIKINFL